MNRLKAPIIVLLFLSLTGMIGTHWLKMRDSSQKLQQLRNLAERQSLATGLILEMEKYRRLSASFKRIGEAEAATAKQKLRMEFNQVIARLDELSPTAEDRILTSQAGDKLAEFLLLSARLEPTLYSRDFYQRPEAAPLHEKIVTNLERVITQSKESENRLFNSASDSFLVNSLKLLVVLALSILLMVICFLVGHHVLEMLPRRRLYSVAKACVSGEEIPVTKDGKKRSLRGIYGEIEAVIQDLSANLRDQRVNRQRLIAAITSELRPLVLNLKTGVDLFDLHATGQENVAERAHANDVVRKAAQKLVNALDDLTDYVENEYRPLKLHERIVDFRAFLKKTADSVTGPSVTNEVSVSGSALSFWTHLDAQRFERMLVHLIAKVIKHAPYGSSVDIKAEKVTGGSFNGIEISILEGPKPRLGRSSATLGEQSIMSHWVSENGYAMELSDKIAIAHGGSITVAGSIATGVIFVVRIPAERIVPSPSRPMAKFISPENLSL